MNNLNNQEITSSETPEANLQGITLDFSQFEGQNLATFTVTNPTDELASSFGTFGERVGEAIISTSLFGEKLDEMARNLGDYDFSKEGD